MNTGFGRWLYISIIIAGGTVFVRGAKYGRKVKIVVFVAIFYIHICSDVFSLVYKGAEHSACFVT